MSEGNVEGVKEQEFLEDPPKDEVGSENSVDDPKDSDNNKNDENPMPSPQQEVFLFPFLFFFCLFICVCLLVWEIGDV